MESLSHFLKRSAEVLFQHNLNEAGLEQAKWAAEARDMETELERLRLQLALLTEEG